MKLFSEKRILYVFTFAISFWLILPLTTKTTGNARFFYASKGYTPVANFRKYHAPPKIRGKIYKQIVWKHERYSLFWLPFWGSTSGEHGFYKYQRGNKRRFSKVFFIPLTHNQAQKYASLINVKLENGSPVSYWSLFFGWLIIIPFALIFYWDPRFYKKLSWHIT